MEMEALTGVSIALLTVYDMCKALDKTMEIGEIYLCHKEARAERFGIPKKGEKWNNRLIFL